MVGASDMAFRHLKLSGMAYPCSSDSLCGNPRLLVRRYGVDCAYTEMALSQQFIEDPDYRQQLLQTCPEDRPLVLQLAGREPQVLAQATALAASSGSCDAVDLNLGCPQTKAQEQVE